jgi:hypothetical protein
MKINFTHKGNFNNLERFLAKSLRIKPVIRLILDKYGKKGVEALRDATPKDTGKTADSWYYEIVEDNDGQLKIVWKNSNVVDGKVNVAILLQYGHATKNGGFVQGIDYINPAIQSIFTQMADEAWKEVSKNA